MGSSMKNSANSGISRYKSNGLAQGEGNIQHTCMPLHHKTQGKQESGAGISHTTDRITPKPLSPSRAPLTRPHNPRVYILDCQPKVAVLVVVLQDGEDVVQVKRLQHVRQFLQHDGAGVCSRT